MEVTSASAQALKEDRAEGSRDEVESGSIYSRHSSKRSRSSRSTTSSRVSYEAARARAKAEAAKTRLAFTEKEGELRVEKARLEAKIDYINLQNEAEAVQAEAEVLEAAAGDVSEPNNKEFDFLPLPESALKRTGHYVTQHTQEQFPQEPKVGNDSTLPPTSTPFPSYNQKAQPQLIDNGASFPQNNAQPLHMNFPQQEDEHFQ